MRTIYRDIATAMIFSADGKLFQGQKDPNKGGVYSDGYWHIPGGGTKEGETITEALIREVREETGLDIENIPYELIDDTGANTAEKTLPSGEKVLAAMKFYVYKIVLPTTAEKTKISLNDDLVTYRWTDISSELKSLKLTPPSVELFTKLGYL